MLFRSLCLRLSSVAVYAVMQVLFREKSSAGTKHFSASCTLSPDCIDCRRYSIGAELEFGNGEYAMSRRVVAECCVAWDRVNRSREKATSDASCILRGRRVSDAAGVSCSALLSGIRTLHRASRVQAGQPRVPRQMSYT